MATGGGVPPGSLTALILLPLAFWIGRTVPQVTAHVGVFLLVLIAELLNSAIETAIDRIGPEHHALSGRAKEIGSAAAFVSLALVVIAWSAIAWVRFA